MEKKKKSNVILKKSSISSLFIYLLIYTIISFIWIFIQNLLVLAFKGNSDILIFLKNTVTTIISQLILTFLSIFLFTKIYRNKYVITDSKEGFLHKFLIFIIIIGSVTLITNLLIKKDEAFMCMKTTATLEKYIVSAYKEGEEGDFHEFVEGTDYEKCNSYEDIYDVSDHIREEIVVEELMQPIMTTILFMIANLIFMEIAMSKTNLFENKAKKEKESVKNDKKERTSKKRDYFKRNSEKSTNQKRK